MVIRCTNTNTKKKKEKKKRCKTKHVYKDPHFHGTHALYCHPKQGKLHPDIKLESTNFNRRWYKCTMIGNNKNFSN